MKPVKKTAEYTILKRKDNRYAVVKAGGKSVNGVDKVAILQAEGLLVRPEPKPVIVEAVEVVEAVAEVTSSPEAAAE